MIIYKTTNLINGKIYIGKTTRKSQFYYGSGIVIEQAIKKYGKKNFQREVLEECDTFEKLNEREKYWILQFNSCDSNIGYNRSFGGDGFSGMTPETKEKLKNRKRRKLSELTKEKISKSNKDKPKSEEHKKSLSVAWEKRKIEKPFTQQTLDKMSNSMIGKNVGKYIKVYEFRGPDEVIYKTDKGFAKFGRSHHIHLNNLRELIRGEREEYHGWTYLQTIE